MVKKSLHIDTELPPSKDEVDTPTTETSSSTPISVSTPKQESGSKRNTKDIRSPGAAKTPMAASAIDHNIPDFITQTDQYGNATTPHAALAARTNGGNTFFQDKQQQQQQQQQLDETEEQQFDACDSLLESLRMMCCCILPEQDATANVPQDKEIPAPLFVSPPMNQLFKTREQVEAGHGYEYKLLPDVSQNDIGKKCLVLDLDETLVHSSFRAVPGADFVIPVQIEDVVHFVYVIKRPGVDEFLVEMAKEYEIVIYTASLNKYADPLLDLLDPHKTIRARLFRESCVYFEGSYVKDLSLLNRDLSQTIIVDNSSASYIFHPENAIDCSSFIDDPSDRELHQIGSFLNGIKGVKDVRGIAPMWKEWPRIPKIDFVEYPVEVFEENEVVDESRSQEPLPVPT